MTTFVKPRAADTRSLEELKEVKERAEKLQEIQEGQDKEIDKHLEIMSSPDLAVEKSDSAKADRKCPSSPLKSPASSVSIAKESVDYSSDSYSDDKENF